MQLYTQPLGSSRVTNINRPPAQIVILKNNFPHPLVNMLLPNIMHTNSLQKVANNIKSARLHRNYSQDYLAAKLKISQNAYSKMELGYTRISLEKLFIIADVLQINAGDLLSNTFTIPEALQA